MERTSSTRPLSDRYLLVYNTLSALLWLGVLGRTVLLVPLIGASNLHFALGTYTKWTQTLALLEILHIALGLLRSSLATTVVQVSSRILLVWGICDRFPAAQETPFYASMLFAWSVTEVCRYSYYVVALLGMRPGVLAWLRYNTFYVLYPLGAGSEAVCVFVALEQAREWDVRYYWFLVLVLVTYPPGLFNQYTHMIRQRRKNMRGKKKA